MSVILHRALGGLGCRLLPKLNIFLTDYSVIYHQDYQGSARKIIPSPGIIIVHSYTKAIASS
ncbi:MAG: hypothetical protein RM338_03795 [Nostoc sp. DedQUE12a]|nr:hypothetical protein [Nostoc sp. DedQUE12a]